MVSQYEPLYSLYQAQPGAFSNLLKQFRNLLFYRTGPEYAEPSIKAEYNKWAENQIVINITGPDNAATVAYMDQHRGALQKFFDTEEQKRFISRANRYVDREIQKEVFDHVGVMINIPQGYKIRSKHPDFIWISYELPLISQGIIIYKYPLDSRNTFTPEYLYERRNEFVSLIPGPTEGSYMSTSDVFIPEVTQTYFPDDRLWFMTQGFWDVAGDFMGGPFTSYSTVNATTREVVTIDTYVFSPKYDKRNYVRQLQSIAQTATLPGDSETTVDYRGLPE